MSKRIPHHRAYNTQSVLLSMPVLSRSMLRSSSAMRVIVNINIPATVTQSIKRMGRGGVMCRSVVCNQLFSLSFMVWVSS